MREHMYHIHDLITVRVDPRVRPWVLKSINQQLVSFQSTGDSGYSNPLVIQVKPFALFSLQGSGLIFQTAEGGGDSWYMEAGARFAVSKTENGYAVYTDSMLSLLGLLQQLLLRRGISLAHAAAVKDLGGNVLVLAGAGGVGKTALAGFLVKEKGYKLLGDDMVLLTDSGECLAFHRPFTLKEYHQSVYPEVFARRKRMGWQRRFLRSVIWQVYSNAPFRGVLDRVLRSGGLYNRIAFIPFIRRDYVDIVPVNEIFSAELLASRGPVARTLFLARSSAPEFSLEERDGIWMASRMFAVLYQELAGELLHLLGISALGLEDQGASFGRCRAILEKAVSGTPCFLLRIPQKATPEELIRAFERLVLKQS